ncbi:BatA domain-containing protein [Candidatus Bipolaricaulota bacterium]|nr:BatA domain-containing protein [Candidatus Bipolaricaulota bacterium]
MTFAFPWAWLWLFSLVPVLLLYFLRKRERDWPVSALFLWEGVKPDRPRFLERLRAQVDLLLFLQVLAVVLSAAALSRPEREVVRPAGATLLVLDASASAAAEGTREEILKAAEKVLRDSAGPWAVVLWAEPPELLVPPTHDLGQALSRLARYEPRLTRRPALARALALLPEPWPRVVVITDDPEGVAGAEVVLVPRPENLGISAFFVRPSPDGLRYEAFLRVFNATQSYKDVQIRLISESGEFWASRLVPPGEAEEVVLVLPGAQAGAFVAELRPKDAFPWDNVRYFVVRGGEMGVVWAGPEDRYLWAALKAAAPVRRVNHEPDLFVAVSVDLPGEPLGPCLLVGAGLPGAPRLGETAAGPLHLAPSPVLENLSLAEWRLDRVWRQEVPPGAQIILWAGEVPVLFLWESPFGRRAALALDLSRSNLPLLPDFPILIYHLLLWLLPPEPEEGVVVGEAVPLPPGFFVTTEEDVIAGVFVPQKPGIFRVDGPKGSRLLAVNVPWEAFQPKEVKAEEFREVAPTKAVLPLWPWTALALLLVLAAEAGFFLWRGG